MRKQRFPVRTQKAIAITATALALTIALTAFMTITVPALAVHLPLLPILQFIPLSIAWVLFRPLDQFLKSRIMRQATVARDRHPNLTVIGITGSVGKTTTKELISHILSDLNPLTTPAHVNTEMGVALWMIKQLATKSPSLSREGVRDGGAVGEGRGEGFLIVEMGAYRKGEIALMCTYVQPTMGVVTFAGGQHVALFGSEEALWEAKSELIRALPSGGHAFLNGDNPASARMRQVSPCPVTVVGTGGSEDMEAHDIAETTTGIRFTVDGVAYDVPLHGTHNVTNVLLAIAVARQCGIAPEIIRQKLKGFRPPERTFTVRDERGIRILDDTHNGSPASTRAAIAWAKTQPYEQKTLLFSGLIELGEDQEKIEADLGAFAAPILSRVIIQNPRSAAAFQQGFGKPVEIFSNTTQPIPPNSLLLCVGRMPSSMITRLLPQSS